MAIVEGCKHSLEIEIPLQEVSEETEKVTSSLQQKVRLPGFRPGKVPAAIIRKRFESDIRQQVVENLVPKHFRLRAEEQNLRVVGQPSVKDVHFEQGEPLRFKAEFEVAPEFDLGEYREVEVTYEEPQVSDEEIDARVEEIRNQKAEYVNEDPRPVADGDFAVVALKSLAGVEGKPIEQDELMLQIGGAETMAPFKENLTGMSPGEEKEFDVSYPEDYGEERLAGKTVRFHVTLKAIRRKEVPELNDEFARDLGDFQGFEEFRAAVRKSLLMEREFQAQQKAKDELVNKLVEAHQFAVPEAYLDRQIESQVEQYLRGLIARGVDPRQMKLDWEKLRESQRDQAIHDVRASLILDKIADREAVDATRDEVDREIQRVAKQEREPVAAVRARLEKEGVVARIANRIRTEKTLNFLFEHARKVPPAVES